ncbi:nuclease SbcCD subunit C [Bacteroidia bacterium]|nr:nuclease SbcCD subunit C [Bacteroidia bacterium]
MKILAIRGKNIASLEGGFELDFLAEPLASAGIFAITGSTGSGKSTLLDTLCLALFDDTPRMSRATENNVVLPDVKDKTINQKDCRTLLRRGTAEGYAEVDFLSLNGGKYRSTWSVKRARGKVDGSLQGTEMRLISLDSGEEVQGRKGELLQKVAGLIGLTFEQFTRAVLLAQGDFATFLKAKQAEKAELLEKLTGTEIYSRISILIYEKTKEAELEYLKVKERIQGVELLPEEQLATFGAERDKLKEETVLLKDTATVIDAKIKWLAGREELRTDLQLAGKSLSDVRGQINTALPRFEFMRRMESVQEIRDTFNKFQHTSKQLDESRSGLAKKEQENERNNQGLAEAGTACAALEKEVAQLDGEWESIEPAINQARALDIQIANAAANREDAAKELKKARASKERLELSIRSLSKETEDARNTAAKLNEWFDANRSFAQLAPQTDLVISLLNDMEATRKKRDGDRRNCEEAAARLGESQARLEKVKARLQSLGGAITSLGGTLPLAEVMALRGGLADGLPCPVCGSLHHPAKHVSPEESLEAGRLHKEQESLLREMEKQRTAITTLKASEENYTSRYAEIRERAETYLQTRSSWEAEFNQGTLQTELKAKAAQWTAYSNQKATAESIAGKNHPLLQNEQENLTAAVNHLAEKAEKESTLSGLLSRLSSERQELLQGRTVDGLTLYYIEKKKSAGERMKAAGERKNKLASERDVIKGAVAQMKQGITEQEQLLAGLQQEINRWLENREDGLAWEQLKAFFAKGEPWIRAEKEFLTGLEKEATTAQATLDERNNHLLRHESQDIKPADEETDELLKEKQSVVNARTEEARNRIAELEAALNNHRAAQERLKAIEKELEEKGALHENWKKLNDLLGSANGSKFKEIAQGYTLDALLAYANKHLKGLSKRYVLQRISGTLALQVADLDMLGEIRTVHSLSGGEAFLLSLALALGLSSLSSNRMKIESLFIDEGFGSLDIDTLRTAMHALESLQTQGRKIGVISHVPEMTEHIPVQIHVQKTSNGKSVISINN